MTEKKPTPIALYLGLAGHLCFWLSMLMVWRAYILADAPPADHLKGVAGIPSSWGSQKNVGTIICMDGLQECLRMAKPGMEGPLVIDALRSGLPVAIRYDPHSLSQWGARIYYSAYELKVDQRMIFSYEDMRDELTASRHFAEGGVVFFLLASIVLTVMAYRRSSLRAPMR